MLETLEALGHARTRSKPKTLNKTRELPNMLCIYVRKKKLKISKNLETLETTARFCFSKPKRSNNLETYKNAQTYTLETHENAQTYTLGTHENARFYTLETLENAQTYTLETLENARKCSKMLETLCLTA